MRPFSSSICLKCLAWLCCALLLMGCKPKVPKGVIQPGKMEKILYDYHLAEGMAYATGDYTNSEQKRMEYRKAVFEKHNVTQAEFDSALVYYYRHADKLHDIYVNVSKRLEDESVALGAHPNQETTGQFGNLTTVGDTALIWNEVSSAVLMPYPPFNVVSFSTKADSAFHKGDKVLLNFDTHFIFQEGSKDAVAYLAIVFSNDSVATQVLHLYSDSHYSLQLPDANNVGIKEVKGFVGLMKGQNNDSETLKLLSLSNIIVIRMRETKKEQNSDANQTQAATDSASHDSTSHNSLADKMPPRTLQEKMAAEGLERHK